MIPYPYHPGVPVMLFVYDIGITQISSPPVNSLRPRQNGRHFADDTFNRIFVNENVRISNKFSLKFVPKGPINNIQALVQIMAWRRPGDKPLSEAMMVNLPTHICVSRPQWVNKWQNTSLKRNCPCHKSKHVSPFTRIYGFAGTVDMCRSANVMEDADVKTFATTTLIWQWLHVRER